MQDIQIILAARSEDVEGWMNTLVIVLLVVFWAIGGILKARARKAEAAEEDEEETGKKPFGPTARRATAKPKTSGVQVPPLRRAPAERGQRPKALAMKIEPRPAKPSVTRPKVQEPKATVAKITGPKKPVSAPEKLATEPLLFAEEPDELKKAILHYEILGKPLSLREPADEGR